MKTFVFRVYCEVTQDGVDASDAANRLRRNINDSSAYYSDPGVVIHRVEEGCVDPKLPCRIARMVILGHEPGEAP